jgi:hypothetical protein
LDFILDNRLLKDIEVFDLTIPQIYDMENFKKVLQKTDKDLRKFMENFLELKACYKECFEDFSIIKIS